LLKCGRAGIDEVGRFLDTDSKIRELDLFEIISILREESSERSIVCLVKMKNASLSFGKCFVYESAFIQFLENEKNGSKIYFPSTNQRG
jgi:hypothetical protein